MLANDTVRRFFFVGRNLTGAFAAATFFDSGFFYDNLIHLFSAYQRDCL